MSSFVNFIEIPAANIDRAIGFYSKVLGKSIERTDFMGTPYAFLPGGQGAVGAIAQGSNYIPSGNGIMVYLDAGKNLDRVLDRVESAGGLVLTPKTPVAGNGYLAVFIDTEGNRIGLHSKA